MRKILNLLLVFVGVLGLISVRFVEDKIFYDPFLAFFKGDFKGAVIPDFDSVKLITSHLFRFLLNLFFSAVVIHFLFLNKKWTIQGVVLMTIAFLFFFPIYMWCLYSKMEIGYLFTFSVRRFVIQPIILLLIIPIFYYRKKLGKD
ncbi:exosortase F system-associated membrane protein [Cloacibacterium sp. TD35]|uniref:exosortase F system-associated membrane protein n=1 Tax=Cloacibacterium sp. TD35 TaxID=2976818 RepID=UPI00237D3EB7|nr:exosortase F system-associated protein [Cloacibacterium sp. TD35]WDT68769.1 exosortase F system-associated protein [Cloacibacterium sp. TD35]